jgi:hypothetical protein
VERVDILQAGKACDCGGESLSEGLGGIFDFSSVESTNTADLEARADLCRKTSLATEKLAPRTEEYCRVDAYVRERTMSKNSWLVGTTGMSFHCVFILAAVREKLLGATAAVAAEAIDNFHHKISRRNLGGHGPSFCRWGSSAFRF